MTKRGTTNRKTTAKSNTARKTSSRGKPTSTELFPPLSLRPEHQRELFALGLITVALVTIIFFFSGSTGLIGARWVAMTQNLLGWGALLVPVALGLLGTAILWQERREDQQLTGATVLGTVLTLIALQALLEFALGFREKPEDFPGEGGGLIGYYTRLGIARLIGDAATLIVCCVFGLAGIMLTFNITFRELMTGLSESFARFVATVWPVRATADRDAPALPNGPRPALPNGPLSFTPPPGTDDIVPTPIAARPTRASLFQRADGQPATVAEAPPAVTQVKPKPAAKEKPAAEATLNALLTAAPAQPMTPTAPEPSAEVVQQPLDGFEVDAVQRAWPMPNNDMLESYPEGMISDDERRVKSRSIEETLASFKVEARVVGVNTGPAVTQFELEPAVGVKVSKVTSLEKDLMMALAASSLRIEAPIPGKKYIGIEIPNSAISIVGLREVIESDEFDHSKHKLRLPLGKDVSGTSIVAGMERMPHLLVAGSTGSGKSVAVNAFICALLLKHTPDNLRFIMVDPKMVELIVYNQIPHLLSPVVTELERVVPTLKWAVREMERRYKVFAKYGFRNIESYRVAARRRADLEPMPYIMIIIDELADLMMMAPDEVETLLCRLAQMARATGIHLILATQRPSVDVVTGLIKANFPSRIAFAVTSQIDSRVILDMNGAEQLLGRGDMLFMASDAAKPVRIQGTYVSDSEVEQIVNFWRSAKPPEDEAPTSSASPANRTEQAERQPASPPTLQGPAEFLSTEEQDELLPEATKLVKQHKRASASLLQRRLRIGYSKAAQLIDLLEQQGVVGPAEEGRSREVLAPDE